MTLPGGPSTNVIRVAGINSIVIADPSEIDYDAALGTVVGVNGLPVVSFTGFPCPAVP